MVGSPLLSFLPRPGWIRPEYVANVVGVLATGARLLHSAITESGPTVPEIICGAYDHGVDCSLGTCVRVDGKMSDAECSPTICRGLSVRPLGLMIGGLVPSRGLPTGFVTRPSKTLQASSYRSLTVTVMMISRLTSRCAVITDSDIASTEAQ
ncbi:hypothetical protein SAMN05443574_11352 [Haloarcula vallismortis]|uniref:Uncharacterized protein n=1 Tax=Haloarcula vallismortis TaxID=28442 RepID=A0A1H2YP14_HALVA|nr:hypothetical protein SAMN05443574_11352 [Haloarcula vallismortis]